MAAQMYYNEETQINGVIFHMTDHSSTPFAEIAAALKTIDVTQLQKATDGSYKFTLFLEADSWPGDAWRECLLNISNRLLINHNQSNNGLFVGGTRLSHMPEELRACRARNDMTHTSNIALNGPNLPEALPKLIAELDLLASAQEQGQRSWYTYKFQPSKPPAQESGAGRALDSLKSTPPAKRDPLAPGEPGGGKSI